MKSWLCKEKNHVPKTWKCFCSFDIFFFWFFFFSLFFSNWIKHQPNTFLWRVSKLVFPTGKNIALFISFYSTQQTELGSRSDTHLKCAVRCSHALPVTQVPRFHSSKLGLWCLIVFLPHVTPFCLFFFSFLSWLGSPLPGHSCGTGAHASAQLMKWRDRVLLALKWKQSLWNLRASSEM